MKSLFYSKFLIILALLLSTTALLAQPRLTNTKSKIVDQKLMITYDILNSTQNDKFKIWVSIKTKSGMKIIPKTISGDIGDNVSGGVGKLIIWNLMNDNIMMAEKFQVNVSGKQTSTGSETTKEVANTERPSIDPVNTNTTNTTTAPTELNYIGTGNALFRSAIFPGWGLSSMQANKPYWLMGVATYGAIASSLYFNNQAASEYDNYKLGKTQEARNTAFDDVQSKNNVSKMSAYTAIGIWAVNMIWTASMAKKAKIYSVAQSMQGFNMHCSMEPISKKPMLTLTYTFK